MNLKLTAVLGLGLSLLACGKCVAQDPNPLIFQGRPSIPTLRGGRCARGPTMRHDAR